MSHDDIAVGGYSQDVQNRAHVKLLESKVVGHAQLVAERPGFRAQGYHLKEVREDDGQEIVDGQAPYADIVGFQESVRDDDGSNDSHVAYQTTAVDNGADDDSGKGHFTGDWKGQYPHSPDEPWQDRRSHRHGLC